MRKKILVLGSSGYVGSFLSFEIQKYHDVVGIDRKSNINCKHFHKLDLTKNFKDFIKLAKQHQILIILAGIVGDPNCLKYKKEAKMINIQFLEELKKNINQLNNLEKIIFTSSCSVYGFGKKLFNEKSKFNPLSFYSVSKIKGEKILNQIYKKTKKDIYILRLSTLFGYSPNMRFDLVPNLFIRNLKINKYFTIYGGNQMRPFISLNYLTRVIKKIIKEKKLNEFHIYNIGQKNQNLSMISLGKKIKKIFKIDFIHNKKQEDKRSYKVDFSRLNKQWKIKSDNLKLELTRIFRNIK